MGGVLALPLLVFAIFSKWGVLILVSLAIVVGIILWIWNKRLMFIEVIAFLIHFDGLGVGPISIGRIMAGLAALLVVYKLISGWRPVAIPARHWVPVWALTCWGVFSGVWSDSAGFWMFALGVYGLGLSFFAVTALLADDHRSLEKFLRAYWIGGLFGSGAGILALFLGTRSVGFGADANFFGLLQASMIPLTIYYRRHAVDAKTKFIYTCVLLFVLAGAAGAGSRSGLIGGAVAIVGSMVTRPGLNAARRVGVSIGSVIVAGVAFIVGFLANPANLQRGFHDRGSGRLDLWNVSIELIKEQPLVGYGFGQIKAYIVPNLLTTPGSQRLMESRAEVSAHNTWLDVTGDLGLIGLLLFVTVVLVALVGFLRPRWFQARELSTTLFVMMLPVLTGSFFLPLLNNKLAWALFGMSAALQVPSWGARWSGLAGQVQTDPPQVPGGRSLERVPPAQVPVAPAPVAPSRPVRTATIPWESVRLARWDLRVSRRFRVWIVVGALIGGIGMGMVGTALPTRYEAIGGIFVPELDGPEDRDWIAVDRARMQGVLTMAISNAYAAELKELSGIELSIPEIRERMSVTRPKMGAYLELHYSDTNASNTEAVRPHLVAALDNVYQRSHEFSRDQTANEIRPAVPGEQRYYDGEYYLRAGEEAVIEDSPPRTAWMAFIGFLTGALVAAGFALAQQRHPRVNNDDDFDEVLGIPMWSHIGRYGRRNRASRGQFAQIAMMAAEHTPDPEDERGPHRFVVASPHRDVSARTLALGLAAELVAEGRRVVLVDAQLGRPMLSARLGGLGRPGLVEVGAGTASLAAVMRQVSSWRLPRTVRKMMSHSTGELRFIPAGRSRRSGDVEVPLDVLDQLDPDITVVLLAPPTLGDVPNTAALSWGDAVVLALVEGRTITFDAEEAAARVRTFSLGGSGVVLLDV